MILPPPLALQKDAALFLDFDGTLTPKVRVPPGVHPDARLNALLMRVSDMLDGKLAVVSGRQMSDLDYLLGGTVTPVVGTHGLERRTASGEVFRTPPHPALGEVKAMVNEFASTEPGLRVETKHLSVALHFRSVPHASERVTAFGHELASATGLAVQPGDMVVELRTPGDDKGDAIAAFLHEAPFAGAPPIYVGDDLTDESGFKAVEQAGGVGVLVGEARHTYASRRLCDVKAVRIWLDAVVSER